MSYPILEKGMTGNRLFPTLGATILIFLLAAETSARAQTCNASCMKCKNCQSAAASPSRHYVQPEKNDFLSTAFPTLFGPDSVLTTPEQKEQQLLARQAQQRQIRQQQLARQQLLQQQQLAQQQVRQQPVRQNPATVAASRLWYDPLGVLAPSAPSPVPQRNVATKSLQPSTPRRPNPSSVQPAQTTPVVQPAESRPVIEQVSYRAPRPASALTGTASPELHKPWDLGEITARRPTASNPYRLASDTQTTRTSPPSSSQDRLVGSPNKPTASTKQTMQTQRESMPIFGIGREFMKELRPSNDRTWSQNHAVLQTAEFNGNTVTIRNVRYSKYNAADEYTTTYYDATFNLDEIRSIDLVIVPFSGMPSLAHVQASFGFADGRHLGMSIEARYEEGEQYDPVAASLRQFELIYVLADERDLIRIGADVNKNDVHIYRLKFEPNEVREMFIDALQRTNGLAKKPEFYHPLRNSCVTNLIAHINKGRPKAIPKEYRTLLPGLMDNYVFDLKLVDTTAKTFKEAKENAKVNWLIEKYGDLEYFSAGIRQNMY